MIQKTSLGASSGREILPEGQGTIQPLKAQLEVVALDGISQAHLGQSNPIATERTKETNRLQKELGAIYHQLGADNVAPIEWMQQMDERWATIPAPTRAQLKGIWLDTLLRPEHTNAVTDEHLLMRTLFETEYQSLLSAGAALVPADPKAALPEAISRASTRFLRAVLDEIMREELDDRRDAKKAGEPIDADPFRVRYGRINDLLVERTKWGDNVPISDFHALHLRSPMDVAPESAFWRQIDRSAFVALANQLKAVHEPKDDVGRKAIELEMRGGSKVKLLDLFGTAWNDSDWTKTHEHVNSLASAIAANPGKAPLLKMAAAIAGDANYGLGAHLLRPLSELAKTKIPAAAKAAAAALSSFVELAQAGAGKADLEKSLGKLDGLAAVPLPHLLAGLMRLHATIEAGASTAQGLVTIEAMTKIALATGREGFGYNTHLVAQSLVQLAARPDAAPAEIDRLLFQLLDARPSASGIRYTLDLIAGSKTIDADRIAAIKAALQASAEKRLDAALLTKSPDVPRFVGDLERTTDGKKDEAPGLLGAYLLVKNAPYENPASARLAKVLPGSQAVLELGLQGSTPTAGLLYGAAYLGTVEHYFSDGQPSRQALGRARAFLESAGTKGAAALGVERLRQTLAILPDLASIEQTFHGPEFKSEGVDALLAKFAGVPNDPVLALTVFEALTSIVPANLREGLTAIADRASAELLAGHGPKARATLEPAFAELRQSLTRPPILDDRAPLCDDGRRGLRAIARRLGVEAPQVIAAFFEVPTDERLKAASDALSAYSERVTGAATAKGLKPDDGIHAELELITALLAPKFDAAAAQVIAERADTDMREWRRAQMQKDHDRYGERPIPSHPIEDAIAKCQAIDGKVRPREVLSQDREHVFQALKDGARSEGQPQIEVLGKASTLIEKLGKMCEGRNSALVRILSTVGKDALSAKTPEQRQLALFEISSALSSGYNTFGRLAELAGTATYVAGYDLAEDALKLRSLFAAKAPEFPADLPEILGRALGNATVIVESLPKDHALGSIIAADLADARKQIAANDLRGAAKALHSASLSALTLADREYVRQQLSRPARAGLEPFAAKPSEMQPGDGIRFTESPGGRTIYGWIGAVKESSFHMYGLGGGETIYGFDSIAKGKVEIFPSRAASVHALLTENEAVGKTVSVDVYERSKEVESRGKLTAFDATSMTLLVDGESRTIKFDEIRPSLRIYKE